MSFKDVNGKIIGEFTVGGQTYQIVPKSGPIEPKLDDKIELIPVDHWNIRDNKNPKDYPIQNVKQYDEDENSRYSALGPNLIIELKTKTKPISIKAIEIDIWKELERDLNYTIAFRTETGEFIELTQDRKDLGKIHSYEFDKPVEIRYLRIMASGNTQNQWVSIQNIKLFGIIQDGINIKEDFDGNIIEEPKPEEPKPDNPNPPTPPTTGDVIVIENTGKNYGKKLNQKLPVLSELDKNGVAYLDLSKIDLQTPTKYQLNKSNENYNPEENNNSGNQDGKSNRLDFQFVPSMYDAVAYIKSQHTKNDDTALKDGGPHNNNREWADCLIVKIKSDGSKCLTQLEPAHMSKSEELDGGYGDYFNEVAVNLGLEKGKLYGYRFTRFNDEATDRIVVILSIDRNVVDGKPSNNWEAVYATVIYGGMGGKRKLKSAYKPYVVTIGKANEAQKTIRFDAQEKPLKKGDNFNYTRITEIVKVGINQNIEQTGGNNQQIEQVATQQ